MNTAQRYRDMQPLAASTGVPSGSCDALYVSVAGTIAFTTVAGTKITGLVVAADTLIPVAVASMQAISSATVWGLYL